MTTKAQRKAIIDEKVSAEKARILEIMNLSDLYTITLDPLIESYLDIFEIYQHKYLLWKEKGLLAQPVCLRPAHSARSVHVNESM